MRSSMAILVLALAPATIAAQNEPAFKRTLGPDDLGQVALSVAVPATMPGFDAAARNQLEARMALLLSSSGLSGIGVQTPFVVFPTVVITDNGVVETGLERVAVVKLDLTLIVKQVSRNLVFNSWPRTLQGTGRTRDAAVLRAISSLRAGDANFDAFARDTRARIVDHYETTCDQIRADARRAAGSGQHQEALAMLLAVPREAERCHTAVIPDVERSYATFQQMDCKARVQRASAAVANREYDAASDHLDGIDPSAPCAKEADSLISHMEEKVDRTAQTRVSIWLRNRRERDARLRPTLAAPAAVQNRRLELARLEAVQFFNKRPAQAFDASVLKATR